MTKKKILFVSYEPASLFIGLNTRIAGIVDGLVSKGYEVDLLCPRFQKDGDAAKRPVVGKCRVLEVYVPPPEQWRVPIIRRILYVMQLSSRLGKFIKTAGYRYDLVQSCQVYPFFVAKAVAKESGARVILDDPTMLEMLVENKLGAASFLKPLIAMMLRMFEAMVFRRADIVICSASKARNIFAGNHPWAEPKLYLLPNGVNGEVFFPAPLKKTRKRIFFNCSLPYFQNEAALENAVAVAKTLASRGCSDFYFDIVVNNKSLIPPDLAGVMAGIPGIVVSERVPSLAERLQMADIVLLPYSKGHWLTAGSRLKAVEALACGKIVITTPEGVDGVDGARDAANCYICSSVDGAAEKLETLLKDENAYREACKLEGKARELIENKYLWQNMVGIYDQL